METGRGSKPEFDELEMLLGEIPNVTSGNPQSCEPKLSKPSALHDQRSSPLSEFTNLYDSPRPAENGGNIVFCGGLTFSEKSSDYKTKSNVKLDDANVGRETQASSDLQDVDLPDDKSFALAFEQLSFKDDLDKKPSIDASINFKKAPSEHNSFQSEYYPGQLSNYPLRQPVIEMSKPPTITSLTGANFSNPGFEGCPPFIRSNGAVNFGRKIDGRELSRQKPESLLGDQRQNFPVYSGAVPANRGMQAYQLPVNPIMQAYKLLPGVPSPGLELTASAHQQQCYFDAQSQSHMPRQYQGNSNMERWSAEVERFHRLNQQHLYLQQLQNQGSIFHQMPVGANISPGPLTGNPLQPYFDMPATQMGERGSRSPFWIDNDAHHPGYNHLNNSTGGENHRTLLHQRLTNITCPTNSLHGRQVSQEVRKQYFPEKILTRSHGLHSLRSLEHNSVIRNHSTPFAEQNGREVCNGHAPLPAVPINGSIYLEDPNFTVKSTKSSDFHSVKAIQMKNYSVDEIVGNIFAMAKDQHGCRFLQRKFAEGSPEDVSKIFVEVIDHVTEIMIDPFGNYLFQKLLEVCNEDQKLQILRAITRKADGLVRISCDMHGTRAVQKLIETLQTEEQYSMIVSSLKSGVVPLIKNINGNHVAQRCLQYLSPEYKEFLFDAAVSHCIELATDRQGCCVLQKCLYHSHGDLNHKLMSEISSNALILSQDPYGNYVVQYVLEQKVPWVTAAILDRLKGNYEYLSTQKYSSNVIEKCLKFGGNDERVKIIQELRNNPHLLQILLDPYGNYVIQSALNECKGGIRAALEESIRPHIPALRNSPYGKKVLSRISLKR